MTSQTYVSTVLQSFFTDYVHRQRSLSAHTVASYRDTWRMLIKHITATTDTPADMILLRQLTRGTITGFLDYLADTRNNSATTRNHRLAAIRVVATYALPDYPEHSDDLRTILAIPPAKTPGRQLHYLTGEEQYALVNAVDTSTWTGRRDQMMLTLTIDTGVRISEVIGLSTTDIHTGSGAYIAIRGKGRKHRATPLSTATSQRLEDYLEERAQRVARCVHPSQVLFPGPGGDVLSRDAIARRLTIHLAAATPQCGSLQAKHITWHSLRHTTAMNLLHAGVDISVIALWLGHEQISTTQIYLHHDLQVKAKAMERTRPADVTAGVYKPPADILAWLDRL